jgi:putative N6-adenine-specific DNA methylase
MERFFAPCPRGLEALLADEAAALGAAHIAPAPGGAAFSGDLALAYRMNLESRIATRILWRQIEAPYKNEDDIYRLARGIAWEKRFSPGRTFKVDATAVKSPLKSLNFATLRVKDALCDRFREKAGERPSVQVRDPDVRVHLFLSADLAAIYLDTSGAPLWQRGMRHANVPAPLKENLAAGILKLSGWQPGTPLLDPMCGGGTFLLEAASIALRRAPGLERPAFGFEKLLGFDPALWQQLRNEAFTRIAEPAFLDLWGSDIDPAAVRATRRNLEQSGLAKTARIAEQDARQTAAPCREPGIWIANPPYGERLGEADELPALYEALGSTLKHGFAGWTAFFISADTRLPRAMRLKPKHKTPLWNGALDCRLYEFDLVEGSHRRETAEKP